MINCSSILCLPDIEPSLIGNLDHDLIKKVHTVVTNATISEILAEEPYGPTAYRNTVRQQIVALCTRLRISLIIIDQLMALSNSLADQQQVAAFYLLEESKTIYHLVCSIVYYLLFFS